METSTKSYRHQDYTVAWVCALPLEMAAAVTMLDERHRDLPAKQNDNNSYILGRIHSHNVVMACLPFGVYGTTSATTVAAQMRYSFESIRFFLMVGIGGGVPSKKNDIRLGDVVVSKPTLNFGGVIQYDFGKALRDGRFERTGVLNKPPPVLLSAISKLEATQMPNPSTVSFIISKTTTDRPNEDHIFAYPGASQDILFDQGYDHPDSRETCSSCDMRRLIERPPRDKHGPKIHYGLIASGNQVIKDSRIRDRLAREYDVLCFEMEAAGLMDNFPCLVIRGICDYSDSHKNKQWQNYAAATAAGYAKELLLAIHGRQVADTPLAELDLSFHVRDNLYRKTPTDVIPRQYTDEELLEKISNFKHKKIHRRLSQKRLHGTTEWFLGHPSFKDWFIDKQVSSLWCSGKIGSGKTMIATAVIDAAKEKLSELKSPVVFFYCDYEYNDELDASFIVSSFIKQICEFLYQQFGHYPNDVASDLQKFFGSKRTRPDFDDLQDVFSRLCRVVPDAIYIVDGVDALQEAHAIRFLKFIQRLFCSPDASQRSRILLLSRDQVPGYINIGTFIHGICQISISTNAMQDIENYIESTIEEKLTYRKLTDDVSLLNEIKKTLLIESSNMFLWVYLQLEILWDTCHTDEDIRFALTTLPRNMEETYERCACRIDFQDGWALKVLKWVSFAKKPLEIEELREAVAFQSTDMKWDANKKPQKDFIIGCCANLVVLDPIDNCVRFAHSSVKQYLEEDRNKVDKERSVSGYPTEEDGDLECGEYCVTYLSFSDFSLQLTRPSTKKLATTIPSPYSIAKSVSGTGILKAFFRKSQNQTNSISLPFRTIRTPAVPSRAQYRFLDYAIANWAFHTRQIHCQSLAWEKFVQLAMCVNETWNFHPWVSGGRSKVSYLHGLFGWAVKEQHKPFLSLVSDMRSSLSQFCDLPLVDEGLPAIHLAAKFGYEEIMEILLKFCDVNNVDHDGYTSLHHAAMKGHRRVVNQILLQKGIKFDIMSITHHTPLWLAASHGFDNIVSRLIDEGSRIETEDNIRRRTPLWRAVENEHYSTANLLLERKAQVECQDTTGQTPLGLALMKRNTPMIDLLLENGAAYRPKDTGLLLEFIQWAIENNNEASVKLLMRRNKNRDTIKLVSLAIHRGYSAVVKMLLEETSSSTNQELLLWAAERTHVEALEQLLAMGTDPNAKDKANQNATALHRAAQSNHTAVMKLLLKSDANVNAEDDNEETPLHWAVGIGAMQRIIVDNEAAIKLLLENGASVNHKSRSGQTPLHKTSEHGRKSVMKLLLDNGAIIHTKNHKLETPLHEATKHGLIPAMKLLIESGANINDTNHKMETPLHEATKHGLIPAMELLLASGADLNSKDYLGKTPLHTTSEHWGIKEKMELLLRSGANVNAKDHLGKTPLHTASEHLGTEERMELLLRSGANIEALDVLGKTPLDLAKQKGFKEGIQLLLENGARQTNLRRR